jgi:hypothetical protein
VDFTGFTEHRGEETQALDVIHVKVSQEDVHSALDGANRSAQPPDPASSVEDEQAAVLGADLGAGCISTVSHCFRTGAGE